MLKRLTITFTPEERQALQNLAEADFRPPKEQIRWILRQVAKDRNLWPSAEQQAQPQAQGGGGDDG